MTNHFRWDRYAALVLCLQCAAALAACSVPLPPGSPDEPPTEAADSTAVVVEDHTPSGVAIGVNTNRTDFVFSALEDTGTCLRMSDDIDEVLASVGPWDRLVIFGDGHRLQDFVDAGLSPDAARRFAFLARRSRQQLVALSPSGEWLLWLPACWSNGGHDNSKVVVFRR